MSDASPLASSASKPSKLRKPAQSRAIRTRAQLIEAAAREFSERGYAATTSKSIARRAEVATGTFYQYFHDKDALLREIAAARLQSIGGRALAQLDDDGRAEQGDLATRVRGRMRQVVTMVMDYHRDDPGLHGVLTERRHADRELEALTSAAEVALVGRIVELLTRWNHPGDRQATAFVLFGMLEGTIHAHVLGHAFVSDERFIETLVAALIQVALPD
jgi:AcrR family transcriptional regulator